MLALTVLFWMFIMMLYALYTAPMKTQVHAITCEGYSSGDQVLRSYRFDNNSDTLPKIKKMIITDVLLNCDIVTTDEDTLSIKLAGENYTQNVGIGDPMYLINGIIYSNKKNE